jgi:hypothetical protein
MVPGGRDSPGRCITGRHAAARATMRTGRAARPAGLRRSQREDDQDGRTTDMAGPGGQPGDHVADLSGGPRSGRHRGPAAPRPAPRSTRSARLQHSDDRVRPARVNLRQAIARPVDAAQQPRPASSRAWNYSTGPPTGNGEGEGTRHSLAEPSGALIPWLQTEGISLRPVC